MTRCSQNKAGGRQAMDFSCGVMVQCIDFFFSKLSNPIAIKYLSCNMQRKRVCLDSRDQSHSKLDGGRLQNM